MKSFAASLSILLLAACGGDVEASHPDASPDATASGPAVEAGTDSTQGAAPFDPAVRARLTLAFDAAGRMPERPHVKTRSRLQAELVDAALVAGDIELARSLAGRITNWRRGLALASIAAHLAETGDEAAARTAIGVAEEAEATITDEFDQGWRRDRVKVTIARAYAHLGDRTTAAAIQATADPVEAGKLAPLSVRETPLETATEQLTTLEEIASVGDLEQARSSLLAMAELYGRHGSNDAKRAEIDDRIRASWKELPIEPRLDVLARMVELDAERGDLENARFTVDEMASMIEENHWNPEDGVALRARIATLLARVEEPTSARKAADDALALYVQQTESIVSIWRGKALRPLAEAYAAIGDTQTATDLYLRGLDEALVNPNGRPRLEDLVKTVISMTEVGHVPDEKLESRLGEVVEILGEPW